MVVPYDKRADPGYTEPYSGLLTANVTVYFTSSRVKLAVTVMSPVTMPSDGIPAHEPKAYLYCAVAGVGVAVLVAVPTVSTFPDADMDVP